MKRYSRKKLLTSWHLGKKRDEGRAIGRLRARAKDRDTVRDRNWYRGIVSRKKDLTVQGRVHHVNSSYVSVERVLGSSEAD